MSPARLKPICSDNALRNPANLVEKSGRDLITYTAGPESVRKISRYMLETVGDLTWHYHAGIRTVPFQVAVQHNIPLIVWGEHGFAGRQAAAVQGHVGWGI